MATKNVVISLCLILLLLISPFSLTTGANNGVMDEEVAYVILEPEDDFTTQAGQEELFDAAAYDENDGVITDDPEDFDWQNVENGVFYEEDVDEYDVVATYEGESNETTVTVEPADPDYIVVEPEDSTIEAGATQTYTATSYDEFHNEIQDVTGETDWSDDVEESEWDDNELTPYSAGEWTVTGTYTYDGEYLEDTVDLEVEHGPVDDVTIYPDEDQVVDPDEQLLFDVDVEDEWGNLITDDPAHEEISWLNAPKGVFREQEPGAYEVMATYDEVDSDTVTVTVTEYYIEADDATATAGVEDEITVTAYEADNEEKPEEEITVEDDDDLEGIDIGDMETTDEDGKAVFDFEETEAGVYNVVFSAEEEDITDTAEVTIEAGEPDTLEIIDSPEEITAGDAFEVTINATDEYDNLARDQELENFEITIDEDDVVYGPNDIELDSEGEYTAQIDDGVVTTAVDKQELTADADEVESDNETITVSPGDADSLEIDDVVVPETTLEDIDFSAGDPLDLTVFASDYYGNPAEEHVLNNFRINTEEDGEVYTEETITLDEEGRYTAEIGEDVITTADDEQELTADADDVTGDSRYLGVDPAVVDLVEIDPEGHQTITAGTEIDFEAEAFDAYYNLITEDESDFTWENADDGLFDETTAGEYEVKATYDGESSESTIVRVEPGDVEEIQAEDVTVDVQEEDSILVTAFDEYGNEVENEIISVDENDDDLGGIDVSDSLVTDEKGEVIFDFLEEEVGRYDVKFSAENDEITDTSTVIVEGVRSIDIENQPQTDYDEGDTLDLSDLEIRKFYVEEDDVIVPYEEFEDHGLEADLDDGEELSIEYHDGETVTVTHTPTGEEAETDELSVEPFVENIEVVSQPELEYEDGDELDLSDLQVTKYYTDDSTEEDIPYEDFEDHDLESEPDDGDELTADDHDGEAVTVTHDPSGETAETYELSVEPFVESIEVVSQPELEYDDGDELDLSDLQVTKHYTDDSTEEDIPYEDFEDHDLEADPDDGEELSIDDHDGESVTVTYDPSEETADTDELSVDEEDDEICWWWWIVLLIIILIAIIIFLIFWKRREEEDEEEEEEWTDDLFEEKTPVEPAGEGEEDLEEEMEEIEEDQITTECPDCGEESLEVYEDGSGFCTSCGNTVTDHEVEEDLEEDMEEDFDDELEEVLKEEAIEDSEEG